MRRRRIGSDSDDVSEVNLTPMLDVVFIMLIFFIVTTSFIKESGVEINRPESSAASPRPDAQVMVALTAEGAIWVDGEAVDAHRVGQHVAALVRDEVGGEGEGEGGGEGRVVIKADRESTTGLLIEVMDRIRQAGVEDMAVAATRGDP